MGLPKKSHLPALNLSQIPHSKMADLPDEHSIADLLVNLALLRVEPLHEMEAGETGLDGLDVEVLPD